jgi:hypothetical protein
MTYKAFACGDHCHPDRYTSFTTRTWFGRRRWGVFDQHLGSRLARLCNTSEALEHWMASLRTMELRERQSMQNRRQQRNTRP